MRRAVVAVAALLALSGCSDSGPDASVCVDALDEADVGFDSLARSVRQAQVAIDAAFDGHLAAAHSALASVHVADPSRYKVLEAQCRDAVGR